MTVGYMRNAATANFGTFIRLLFRWRGSVWKAVYKEMAAWLFIYNWISFFYRLTIKGSDHEERFNDLVKYADKMMSIASTALIFALGFYVSHIATRWWNVFMEIPWPDTVGLSIAAFVHTRPGMEREDRTERMAIMRYLVLSYVLVFREISTKIRTRFPTFGHLMPVLMTEPELKKFEEKIVADERKRTEIQLGMPIEWSLLILRKCFDRRQISDVHFVIITSEILKFRTRLQNIRSFDWINVPLVYSQVVFVATYVYFTMALVCRQFIGLPEEADVRWRVDYVIPVFTLCEMVCLIGWLKCAQVMVNPFGQDDDDFEVDSLIERNLAVSMAMIDDLYDHAPPLLRVDIHTLPRPVENGKAANGMVGSAAQAQIHGQESILAKAFSTRKSVKATSSVVPDTVQTQIIAPADTKKDDKSYKKLLDHETTATGGSEAKKSSKSRAKSVVKAPSKEKTTEAKEGQVPQSVIAQIGRSVYPKSVVKKTNTPLTSLQGKICDKDGNPVDAALLAAAMRKVEAEGYDVEVAEPTQNTVTPATSRHSLLAPSISTPPPSPPLPSPPLPSLSPLHPPPSLQPTAAAGSLQYQMPTAVTQARTTGRETPAPTQRPSDTNVVDRKKNSEKIREDSKQRPRKTPPPAPTPPPEEEARHTPSVKPSSRTDLTLKTPATSVVKNAISRK